VQRAIAMIIAIHQPNYLPYLGFFHKMAQSDIFVLLDNVQFVRDLFQQRNKIKTSHGWMWLTVPVKHNFLSKPNINEIEIDLERNANWGKKHWNSLTTNYGSAPYFKKYKEQLHDIYCFRTWTKLVDLNETLIKWVADELKIKVKFVRASSLGVEGKSTELLVNICKSLGADTYLSGRTGKSYMDEGLFIKNKINLQYHHFIHPTYKQLFGDFIPNMCILDLLFNHGDKSLDIIMNVSD
jgi:hypothetical protein